MSAFFKWLKGISIHHRSFNRKILFLCIFTGIPSLHSIHSTDYVFVIHSPISTILQTAHHNFPTWMSILVLVLSNDIELNPGNEFHDGFLSFCNWNLNSLSKNDFERISLLEAHNSIFDYDVLSLCQTSLNDQTVLLKKLIENYEFVSCNNPSGNKHGGVGIFFKDSLPLEIRRDSSFDECLFAEIRLSRKKYFFL